MHGTWFHRWSVRWKRRILLARTAVRDTITNLQMGNQVQRSSTDFRQCERPVLLLYGFGSTRRTLRIIELRLRRRMQRCVFSLNLGGYRDTLNTAGIQGLAQLVDAKVERFCTKYGVREIDIVAHSKGGLIARYYVQNLGGSKRVRHLVTLGTPHRGTWMALAALPVLGWIARSLWSMTPLSPMIRSFRTNEWPADVALLSLASRADWVAAPERCRVEETQGTNIVLDHVSHTALLYSKDVFEQIVLGLQARPGAPAPRPSPDPDPDAFPDVAGQEAA